MAQPRLIERRSADASSACCESLWKKLADEASNATRIWWFATAPDPRPGETSDNSPIPQRRDWEPVPNVSQVPKGRLHAHTFSAVPSGLKALYARPPNVETLGYSQASLRDEDEFLTGRGGRRCRVSRGPVTFLLLFFRKTEVPECDDMAKQVL